MPGPPLSPRKVTGHGEQIPEQARAPVYARGRPWSGDWWFSSTCEQVLSSRARGVVPRCPRSLDLDGGPGLFELLLDRLGFVLGNAFLDGGGSGLDEVLGLLETEARDLAHRLDDVDLLVARRLEDHV